MRYNLIVAVIILIPLQFPMVDKLAAEAVARMGIIIQTRRTAVVAVVPAAE